METHTAGLASCFSPHAKLSVTGRHNEDAYYAACHRWSMPAWISRFTAVLAARSRPAAAPLTAAHAA